jgi:hypothetical protein
MAWLSCGRRLDDRGFAVRQSHRLGGCAVASWEYCQLSPVSDFQGGDLYHVTYYSPQQDAFGDVLQDEFKYEEEAINSLGEDGWEAFHIDREGDWYFKRKRKH